MRPERWFDTLPLRLRSLLRRERVNSELDDELRFHLHRQIAANVAAGMPPEAARQAALREFGGVDQIREECADTRRVNWLHDFAQDIRYALRMLRKSPGFTIIAVLTLAIGIGANTAIFSVVNAALFSSPYSRPNRIFYVGTISPFTRQLLANDRPLLLNAVYESWDKRNHSCSAMAAYSVAQVTLTGVGSPEMLHSAHVTRGFFGVLGVRPVLGRAFHAGEGGRDEPATVILSNRLWRDRFASNPKVIGRMIRLDDRLYTIVGVMPARFEFPEEGAAETDVLLANDLSYASINGNSFGFVHALGRLKPGITLENARSDLELISHQDANESHGVVRKFLTNSSVVLVPIHDRLVGKARPVLLTLWSAVGFLFLIACLNVANMTLARGVAREREIAVRVALGAHRGRIARQLLTENLVTATLGAVTAVALAYGAIVLVRQLGPANLPRLRDASVNLPVLAFTAVLAVLAGILAGLAPIRAVLRFPTGKALKEGTRSSAGRGPRRLRNALMVAEIAMALVLAIGSGLLVRTFFQITAIDLGLNPHNVLTAEIAGPAPTGSVQTNLAAGRLLAGSLIERVERLPGVRSAALTNFLPMTGFMMAGSFQVRGRAPVGPTLQPTGISESVGPGYFQTMRIPIIAGRGFEPGDAARTARLVIVNQTLARGYLLPGNPVGQQLEVGEGLVRIIGVVGDTRQVGLLNTPMPTVYYPYAQYPLPLCLVIRTTGNPLAVVPALRAQLQSLDNHLPVFNVATMEERLGKMEADHRFEMVVLGIFALTALVLAALGTYGVTSYSVTEQTREIGIRIALGAEKSAVMRSVVGKALTLALVGVGLGTAGALALTGYLRVLLYEVRPDDPWAFTFSAAVLLVAALLAAYVPARRAMRVDPMVALRHE